MKPLIGIWWYTDSGEVWAESTSIEKGILSGMYLQYSDTEDHLTLWTSTVKKHVHNQELQQSIIKKGYKSIERGRVIYNTATMVYEITCSRQLIFDKDFRQNIVDFFHLSESRFEFVALNHYYKIELTGNSALDEFIQNNQY